MADHAEAAGATPLVVPLADGRAIEVAASDGPFVIDEPPDDDDDETPPTVDVDGLWVGLWATGDQRLDGAPPVTEAECAADATALIETVRRVVS